MTETAQDVQTESAQTKSAQKKTLSMEEMVVKHRSLVKRIAITLPQECPPVFRLMIWSNQE